MASSSLVVIPVELPQWLQDARAESAAAWPKLLTFCRSYLRSLRSCRLPRAWQAKEGADDLVQETLTKFHRNFHRLRNLTVDAALDFLCCIWKRTWKNCARRYGRRKRDIRHEQAGTAAALDGDLCSGVVSAALTPLDALIAQEEQQGLEAALGRFAEEERNLIVWHYLEEMPFAEIAKLLGCSEHAAQQRCRTLRDHLQQELNSGE